MTAEELHRQVSAFTPEELAAVMKRAVYDLRSYKVDRDSVPPEFDGCNCCVDCVQEWLDNNNISYLDLDGVLCEL